MGGRGWEGEMNKFLFRKIIASSFPLKYQKHIVNTLILDSIRSRCFKFGARVSWVSEGKMVNYRHPSGYLFYN